MKSRLLFLTVLFSLVTNTLPALANDDGVLFGMERRRDQFRKDFGYFFYPLSGSVPGIGTAYGAGGTVTNIGGTDTDITGFYITGDFSASGVAILNYHLLQDRVIFDIANYTASVAAKSYTRGIDSSKDDFLHVRVDSEVTATQLTYSNFNRQLELYARYGFGSQRIKEVIDSDGNAFENVDSSRKYFQALVFGFSLDVTDDRQDPRMGSRLEIKDRMTFLERGNSSAYDVLDVNLTYYHPVGETSVWAFNAYYSTALITAKGITDRDQMRAEQGLQCDTIADPEEKANCQQTENTLLDMLIAQNIHGQATALGGTQRLRSYPMGRYYAGQAVAYGTELRWNLTDENTEVDWFIIRGLRTNIQLVFFADIGSVADSTGDLHKNMKTSVGTGLRILFTGVTIRLDVATGDEGTEMQLMLDYPWSMFSVDSPI